MKLFTICNIILLLFLVEINNVYAVKPATNLSKAESLATESVIIQKDKSKKKQKASFLKNIKERINQVFSTKKVQEANIKKGENIDTKRHGLALASLILGILGIPLSIFGFGLLLAVLAIIFGAISLQKIRRSGGFYTGKGMAKAGLILGIIPVAVFLIFLLIFAVAGGF